MEPGGLVREESGRESQPGPSLAQSDTQLLVSVTAGWARTLNSPRKQLWSEGQAL